MKKVRFPEMRNNLTESIRSLSDTGIQSKFWIEKNFDEGFYDSFDEVIHSIYDDSGLGDDPISAIGDILLNVDKANQLKKLMILIDELFDKHGKDKDDEYYTKTNEWTNIVMTAKDLIRIFDGNQI